MHNIVDQKGPSFKLHPVVSWITNARWPWTELSWNALDPRSTIWSQINGKLCAFGFEVGQNHLRVVDSRHIVRKCFVSRKRIVEINAHLNNYLHILIVSFCYRLFLSFMQLNQSINIESHLKPEIRRIDWIPWQIIQRYSWVS